MVLVGGAFLSLPFIIAGEVTTYSNNRDAEGYTYAQVAVDAPGYNQTHPKGAHKLVALVAIQVSYATSITASAVIYGVACALVFALAVVSSRGFRNAVRSCISDRKVKHKH